MTLAVCPRRAVGDGVPLPPPPAALVLGRELVCMRVAPSERRAALGVSRAAASLTACADGRGATLRADKQAVYVCRSGGCDLIRVGMGKEVEVHSGDAVFLDKERCFGVDVVPGGGGGGGLGDAAPRRAAKRSPTAGGGDQGADEESPPKKQAISAQSGVTVGPSPDASAKVSPSKATGASASTSPTASSRLLFAFVGVTHDGMMRRLAAERLRAKCVGLAASSAPPTGTTHVILPNTPAPALAAALRQSGVLAATGDGLPAFAVVPEAWVAACNRARAVVDTTPHAAALARALTAAEAAAVDAATVAAKTETTSGGAPRAGSWRARGSKARGRAQEPQASPVTPSPGMLSTPDASQSPLQPSAAVAAAEAKASVASAAVAGPSGAAVATAPPPAHATAVATVPVPGPLTSAPPAHPHAPAYHAAARTFTGGASGVAWGTGDVWVEPYTVEGANRTLDKLFGHYAHAKEALPASRARHASVEDRAWGELPACGHVACCGRGSCLVAPLQELCDNYLDADKTTFFKKRHLKNGIEAVKCSPHPLRTPADVAALVTPQGRRLGRETIAKIAEVVEHGDLLRNVAARTDERHKTLKLLTTIYGVGEKTAALWYSDGVRTLDDALARTDLSAMQRMGLELYDDLATRIPAAELAALVGDARAAAFAVLGVGPDGRAPGQATGSPAHVRALGSYCRACSLESLSPAERAHATRPQADFGDCDLLISAPDTDDGAPEPAPHSILPAFMNKLREMGYELQGQAEKGEPRKMGSVGGAVRTEAKASWNGVARKGGGTWRRLDVRVYPRHLLPLAVCYFTGEAGFGRALRYYSTTADEARTRARKAHESANGFHLSDMGMQPVHRAARRVNGVVQEVAYGLPVEPTCETDIFAALGLEYVPPHMRSFIRRL